MIRPKDQKKYVVRCFYCCKAVLATMPNYFEGGLRPVRHYHEGKMCEGRYDFKDAGHELKYRSELLESEKKRLADYLLP